MPNGSGETSKEMSSLILAVIARPRRESNPKQQPGGELSSILGVSAESFMTLKRLVAKSLGASLCETPRPIPHGAIERFPEWQLRRWPIRSRSDVGAFIVARAVGV